MFVANRVAVIRDNSAPGQWGHVPGDENPADVISRGCVVSALPVSWSRGPPFLMRYKSEWLPDDEVSHGVLEGDPEVIRRNDQCVSATIVVSDSQRFQHPVSVLTKHYSSFYRLKKAVSWLMRFKVYLKEKKVIRGPVSCSELRSSEQIILRHVQNEVYKDDLEMLRSVGKVKKSSPLRMLSPRLHNGLIVVGGRLVHAPIVDSMKSPVILPHGHPVSRMLILECHNDTHVGTEWLLSHLRRRFWIVRARSMIKEIRRNCVTCRRLYASPATQRMADLPRDRCQPYGPAFKSVGVRYFWTILCKSRTCTSQALWVHIFLFYKPRRSYREIGEPWHWCPHQWVGTFLM